MCDIAGKREEAGRHDGEDDLPEGGKGTPDPKGKTLHGEHEAEDAGGVEAVFLKRDVSHHGLPDKKRIAAYARQLR